MRFPDWPERLAAFLSAREHTRFKWGKRQQDCCSFAAQAVELMTGADVMAALPDYVSADEADLILSTPLDDLLDQRFPRRPCPALAQRGDVALAELDNQDTVMIVEGDTLVGPGRRGLVRLPRSAMRAAWAV